jgi:hypothetical protein
MRPQRTPAPLSTRQNRAADTRARTSLGSLCGLCVLVCVTVVSADTLVLRDGNRIEGTIIAMRDGVIEFEARRGFLGRERMRVERDDVVRIEFDRSGDDRRGLDRDRGDSRDRNDSRDGRRPSGLREREVSVDSWLGWKDTGIDIRGGQTLYFSADGRVRWGPNRQDGPAGEHNSPRNDARPIPARNAVTADVDDSVRVIDEDNAGHEVSSLSLVHLGVPDDDRDIAGASRPGRSAA